MECPRSDFLHGRPTGTDFEVCRDTRCFQVGPSNDLPSGEGGNWRGKTHAWRQLLSNGRLLLSWTVTGLEQGRAVPEWVLGGGTALMLHANHRLSKDIDAFIDDPQYLGMMSPKVTEVWGCRAWDETAHYLKLKYAEGEIDFIVSGPLSGLGTDTYEIDLTDLPAARKVSIQVEPPAEIALKKMHYRPTMLKPRDIFDILLRTRSITMLWSET